MKNWLYFSFQAKNKAQSHRAHSSARPRSIRNIHTIYPLLLQPACYLHYPGWIVAPWRHYFDAYDEFFILYFSSHFRFIPQLYYLFHFFNFGWRKHLNSFSFGRLKSLYSSSHSLYMGRSCTATSSHYFYSV